MRLLALAATLLLAGPALAQPLRSAVDGTFAPHAMAKLGGGVEGFNVDLFTEVARRVGREITIDSANFGGLIPAMNAGRYDFLAAPVTVTKERAEAMIFTQGYLWTQFQFGIKKGSKPLAGWEDLKGKAVAVNKGTPYQSLAEKKAQEIGFEVQVYDTNPDAVQAVVVGRAYANLAGNTVVKYASTRTPMFVPDLVLKDTRAEWAAPFRKDSVALRNQIQDVLACMKRDGTVAKLSEKWFGSPPADDDLERVVAPGYGVPGMTGYDPTPHEIVCK